MEQKLLINNHWQEGKGNVFKSVNPVSQKIVWEGRSANLQQVNEAVIAAQSAFSIWQKTNYRIKLSILRRFAGLLEKQKKYFTECIGLETGKPLWDSANEVLAMINKIEISIKAYQERSSAFEKVTASGHSVIHHRPHGVVAVFGPYNFPGHLPNGHIVPALLAGNTVVYKPSEYTPMVAEETIKIWLEAGLPEGVINLIQGGKETGIALAGHPDINGLFFTGSSAVGHLLHKQFAGEPGKILALEMGGNNPLIVYNPSNIDAAVYHTLISSFISAGQRCTCARRLFVQNGEKGDKFLDRLVEVTKNIHIGDYNEKEQPFMGALISIPASDLILRAQRSLQQMGGISLLEAKRLKDCTALLSPGIIDVTKVDNLPDEEYFGPLLSIIRYDKFEKAIKLSNKTRYGLSAGLLADDIKLYDQFLTEIRAGIVRWNRPLTGAVSDAPFGGIGSSGNHRPGGYYATDYCAYPVSSLEDDKLSIPKNLLPGLKF